MIRLLSRGRTGPTSRSWCQSSSSRFLLVVQRVRAGSGIAKVGEELAVSGGDTGGQIAGLPHRANGALNTIGSARGDFGGQFQGPGAQLFVRDHLSHEPNSQSGLRGYPLLAAEQ